MPRDFYDLLGVSEEATPDELRAAYRAKAREFHPDVNADDRAGAQFKTVKKAYEVLSDETERAAYDRMGHEQYVSQRMDGLPTTDVGDARGGSRWSRGGTTDRGRDGPDAGGAAGGDSETRAGSESGGASESESGPEPSASASSASSATSTSAGESRRVGASAATAGGTTRTGTDRAPGHAGRRVSPLAAAWASVLAVGALYLGGLALYVRANAAGASALADALLADPVGAATAAHGLGSPAAFAASALAARTPGALFPVGAVLLVAAFVGVVVRFGRGTAWLYAAAAAAPAVGLLAPAALSGTAGGLLLAFVALPAGATLAFALDVGRYLRAG